MCVHPTINKDDAAVRPPGPSEIDALTCVRAGQATIEKHKPICLRIIQTPMRGDVALAFAVDRAVFKDRRAAAKDEIYVAFDVAIFVILPPAVSKQRILPAQKPAVAKDNSIGVNVNGDCL